MYFSILYTTHAIACAVATVAWAGPNRDRNRRYSTPKGQSAFLTELAAMRNACPARFFVLRVLLFNTLPPEISCLGARPSHELKCFSVGNFSPTLLPTSRVTVCAWLPLRLQYHLNSQTYHILLRLVHQIIARCSLTIIDTEGME